MIKQRHFADLLKPLRKRAYEIGISEVAALTGLSRETVYRTVDERGNPRLTTIEKLLKALDMRCDFLVASKKAKKKAR